MRVYSLKQDNALYHTKEHLHQLARTCTFPVGGEAEGGGVFLGDQNKSRVFMVSQESKQRELADMGKYYIQLVADCCTLLPFSFIPNKKLRTTSPTQLPSF